MASPPEYEARSAESFLQAATRKSLGDSLPAPTQTSDAKAAGPRSQSVMTQDFEANSAASLFGFELWDCGTKVFAQANRGIRFHRRIGKLLQTISDAHLECAKKVAKAVERADTCMPNYSHPSMSTSIEGFQGMMRAMTAMTLAQNTFAVHSASSSRHIFDSFSNMEAEIKQLERQHAHLEREMKSVIAAHSESRKKFYDAVSKHKELKESHNWPSDSKVAAKLVEREKEVKRREAELKAAAETLNETRDITNGHSFPSLLKAVYCVEEMRIQTMRQAINQFGCLVRNQKIPFKQIGEQILAASHSVKALEDLKQYQEAVATNLPVPSDEPIEIYDVQTCKVTSFEMDESERAVASLHFLNSSPTSRDDVSPKRDTAREDPGLLKGLKSMFSGLRKKSEGADRAAAGAATGGSALAQRRLSKITVKRFYGLNIDNHLTRKFRGYPVPLIAAVLMEFVLSMEGSKTQGIFRLSAPAGEMAAARNQIEIEGLESDEAIQKAHDAVGNCIVAAVLLKTWLRELPDSILPQRLYGRCVELSSKPGMCREGVTQVLQSLPRTNLCTLKALALFLQELSESSDVTRMGLDNFAIVFAPCWLRNPSDDPATLLMNTNKEIAFAKEALAVLCSDDLSVNVAASQ